MSKDTRTAALLVGEKEYMDVLAERLCAKHGWEIFVSDTLLEEVKSADLIVAEILWYRQLEREEGMLDKTVFLMEEEVPEQLRAEPSFPRMAYKYDGFRNIEKQLSKAMDALQGGDCSDEKKAAPVIVLGAWEGGEEESRRIAGELARRMDNTVLYMGLERFPQRREVEGEDCCLEDLLYYALDRLELPGKCRENYIRAILSFSDGVCFLPGFTGMNPLCRLEREQWKCLLPLLCHASSASAVLLWTGRESLTLCGGVRSAVKGCAYLRPEREDQGWMRLFQWMKREGKASVGAEIRIADSWTELSRMAVNFCEDVA